MASDLEPNTGALVILEGFLLLRPIIAPINSVLFSFAAMILSLKLFINYFLFSHM